MAIVITRRDDADELLRAWREMTGSVVLVVALVQLPPLTSVALART